MDIQPRFWWFVLVLQVVLLAPAAVASPADAQQLPFPPLSEADDYEVPADLDRVHFYLLTVAPGDSIWDNFGHTALRVYDENAGTDTVYNWGLFDLSGGLIPFAWEFFKGDAAYRLGRSSPAAEFGHYRSQRRSVWQDRINLTPPQKARLYRRLLWNTAPGNIEYPYHYFHDNCTTRVRDYLQEGFGDDSGDTPGDAPGAAPLAARFTAPASGSYREEIRRHYATAALVGFSLGIIMNGDIDRPMSQWEAMFLPLRLRDGLARTPSDVLGPDGRPLPLLSEPQTVMAFPPPRPEVEPYRLAALLLLAPTLYLLLLIRRVPPSWVAYAGIGLKAPRVNFRVLGLLGLVTALFSGVYGSLMLAGWFLSSHQELHHNINLLLFWPTDLAGLGVALYWLATCRPWPMTRNSRPFINHYLLAHVAGMAAYVGLALSGRVAQEMDLIALYVVPGFLFYTLLIWVVGFAPVKPGSMYLSRRT